MFVIASTRSNLGLYLASAQTFGEHALNAGAFSAPLGAVAPAQVSPKVLASAGLALNRGSISWRTPCVYLQSFAGLVNDKNALKQGIFYAIDSKAKRVYN